MMHRTCLGSSTQQVLVGKYEGDRSPFSSPSHWAKVVSGVGACPMGRKKRGTGFGVRHMWN